MGRIPAASSRSGHPVGRWADLDATHDARGVAWAEVASRTSSFISSAAGVALLLDLDLRQAQLLAGEGRDLARDAGDAEEVAAMRLDVEVDHCVAEQLAQRDAERRIFGQDVDAGVVVAQAQLARRAEHALREHAHRLLLGDDDVADLRAERRQRHLVVQLDVARAADDAELARRRR